MKLRLSCSGFLLLLVQIFSVTSSDAQDNSTLGRTAFSFNLTRMAVNEVNMGIERFISSRRSIEFSGGIIYANEVLAGQVNDWTNAEDFFSEHGFALRAHYKMFRRTEGTTKWREYIAPGITFKDVYYNDKPVTSSLKPSVIKDSSNNIDTVYYKENFLRKRDRIIFGVEFLWGKVYEASRTFAFEFYLGARIDVTQSTHTDHQRYTSGPYNIDGDPIINDQWQNQSMPTFKDEMIYFRPLIQAGIKLRLRM